MSDQRGEGSATIPSEAWDETHPDHNWWVSKTGLCLADCPPDQHREQTDA